MAIRERSHPDRLSVITNPCGRCGGTGILPFWNDSTNSADETFCGICSGSGQATLRFDTIGSTSYTPPNSGQRHYAGEVSSVKSTGRRKR